MHHMMLAPLLICALALATPISPAAAASFSSHGRFVLDGHKEQPSIWRPFSKRVRHVTADAAAEHISYLPGYYEQSAFDMYAG